MQWKHFCTLLFPDNNEKYILPEPEEDIPGYSQTISKAVNRIWAEFTVFTI